MASMGKLTVPVKPIIISDVSLYVGIVIRGLHCNSEQSIHCYMISSVCFVIRTVRVKFNNLLLIDSNGEHETEEKEPKAKRLIYPCGGVEALCWLICANVSLMLG